MWNICEHLLSEKPRIFGTLAKHPKDPGQNAGRCGATGQLGSGPDRHSLRRAYARNQRKNT